MPYPQFDRRAVRMKPLAERVNKLDVQRDHVPIDQPPATLRPATAQVLSDLVDRMATARAERRSIMLTFGAHTIKNGLAPVLIHLMEQGWLTHLATNGAGIIHDWEFAYQGKSGEDVRGYVKQGQFGNWQETGFFINLALNLGAYRGLGYGESIGAMIEQEGLDVPAAADIEAEIGAALPADPARAAAAADLLGIVRQFDLAAGRIEIAHPWKQYSVQAAAYRLAIPLTGHPMFGHDIIYNHPMNHGASIGRVAQRDFLTFAEGVRHLDHGVYLSVGSAIMSPMVFEKSMSMAQNLALQHGESIDNHYILVVDLAESRWDWSQGEPPEENPDYYLRYNKSFSRMGGTMRYVTADNRDFLLALDQALQEHRP